MADLYTLITIRDFRNATVKVDELFQTPCDECGEVHLSADEVVSTVIDALRNSQYEAATLDRLTFPATKEGA